MTYSYFCIAHGAVILSLLTASSHASIYVARLQDGVVGKYDNESATLNEDLITGFTFPRGIALSEDGLTVYVANDGGNSLGKYDAVFGTTINHSLIPGLLGPVGVAVSGAELFVLDISGGIVGKYTTSGDIIDEDLFDEAFNINGFRAGIAVSGGFVYVTNASLNIISKFTTSGSTVNETLISGLSSPRGIAISDDGQSLYVANDSNGTVGKYNAITGAEINASLISGLNNPRDVVLLGSRLFVTSNGNLEEYDTSGNIRDLNEFLVQFDLNTPGGLAVSARGGPGDFDGDGDLDFFDFATLTTNLHADLANLTAQEAYLLGDITPDRRIDGRDFVAFRTAFDEANGVGAFVTMLNSVPEPSTGALAVLGPALLAWRRWR